LQVSRFILKTLPIEILKWQWVESHQWEKGMLNLVDYWAWRNDWCDTNAMQNALDIIVVHNHRSLVTNCWGARWEADAHICWRGFVHKDIWKADTCWQYTGHIRLFLLDSGDGIPSTYLGIFLHLRFSVTGSTKIMQNAHDVMWLQKHWHILLRFTFAPYAQIVTNGTNSWVSTHVTTKSVAYHYFWENLLTNNLKISAQLKAPFHALCLKVPINSSLARHINICLCIVQCAWNKGLN
jgi:hypothetical protein